MRSFGDGQGETGEAVWFLSDHLSSTSVTVDENGQALAARQYDPWGGVRGEKEEIDDLLTDYTYTGQRSEAALGLMYYVARWYDSGIGHFVQADTIVPGAGNPAAWNRYGYVMYNPLKYVDPSGHQTEGVWCMNHPDDPGCQSVDDGSGGQSGSTPQPTPTPEPPLVSETAIVPTPQPKPVPPGTFSTIEEFDISSPYLDWGSYIGLPARFSLNIGEFILDALEDPIPGLDFDAPDSDSYGFEYELLLSEESTIDVDLWIGVYFRGVSYVDTMQYSVEKDYMGNIVAMSPIEGSQGKSWIGGFCLFTVSDEKNLNIFPWWYIQNPVPLE
jgi:RHS repeat-associated protein